MDYKGRVVKLLPNRVWRTYPGGKTLDTIEGKAEAADTHFPEDWIGSTTRAINKGREEIFEGVATAVIDGAEIALPELLEKDPDYFLGGSYVAKYGTKVMVLVKFLDSAIRLHVQCHPTIPFAKEFLNSNSGKTEAYHILGHREDNPEPYIYLGFQNPPELPEFKRLIEEQDIAAIESCFEKIPVSTGDTFIIPGGFPHAIGEGVFMVEVMEPTDFAVRIEFEKAGYVLPESARFMDRGIDFALSMFDYTPTSVEDICARFRTTPRTVQEYGACGRKDLLIGAEETPCFTICKSYVTGAATKREDSAYIGIVTKGGCTMKCGGGEYKLNELDKFFMPCGIGEFEIESENGVEILECYPPIA